MHDTILKGNGNKIRIKGGVRCGFVDQRFHALECLRYHPHVGFMFHHQDLLHPPFQVKT